MILRRFYPILLLLLVPLIIIFSWFRDGGLLGQGEETLPFYDISVSLKFYSTTWRSISTGYYNSVEISKVTLFSILKWLSDLGIQNFLLQAFVDYILMVIGVLAVYFLVKRIVGNKLNSDLIPVVAALFYLLNPFSVSQIWGRGLYMQYFPFALLPLFLLLYVIAIQKRKILLILIALIVSFILAPAFQHITYVIDLWFLIFFYSLFYLYYNRTKKDAILIISYFSILFIGWILTQGWWLSLYFISTAGAYSANSSAVVNENLGTFLGVSRDFSLPTIIRLLQDFYFFRDSKYGEIYKSIFLQLISWLIPLITLFSLKYFKRSKGLKLFGILFLIGLFVSLGANFPFGFLFTWLFLHIPPLQIFRNPYEKFGLIYSLAYSVLFAAGLSFIYNKIQILWGKIVSRLALCTVILLILGVYAWPLWTGRVISGVDKKVGILVPSYYKDLATWLKDDKSTDNNYRLMMLPIASGEGVVYQWGDRLYNGFTPSDYLLDYPSISNNPHLSYIFDYMQGLRKYISQIDVAPAMSLLGSRYMVNREDMVMISPGEKQHLGFLLDTIYPPDSIENIKRVVCTKNTNSKQVDNSIWFSCALNSEESNWQDVKYLHLKIATDRPSLLDISIRDSLENRPVWQGQVDPEYSTSASGYEEITLPINAPSQFVEKTNFSDIRLLEIMAFPKDKQDIVQKVDLAGVWLDSGKTEKINEYKFIKSFGALKLYENIRFTAPPHFGILNEVLEVKNFKELFQEALLKRDRFERIGFLLPGQNEKKDIKKLLSDSEGKVLKSAEISNTKYFIQIDTQVPVKLILGERFDSNWKVIPDVTKKDLDGSLLNNIKLLKKVYLDESKHFVVNGYANLWYLDEGNQSYAVVLLPQLMRDAGYTISLYILGIISVLATALIIKGSIKVKH